MKLKHLYQGVTGFTVFKPLPLFFEKASTKRKTKKIPKKRVKRTSRRK